MTPQPADDTNTLAFYENELWDIVRYHNNEIKIEIRFGPDYGTVFYDCTMTVCNKRYASWGRNLWKRYRDFVTELKLLYGDNAYKYGTKPVQS